MSRRLLAPVFAALLLLAACGGDDDSGAPTDETSSTTAGEDGGPDAPVTTSDSEHGEILVDADGFTLYGFTNDTDGTPTCVDACAATWPPVFVDSEDALEGLDPAVFSTVEHPSGQLQVKAGDWPLYLYAPDAEAGDTEGQGVGDIWFVVDPQGQLIME